MKRPLRALASGLVFGFAHTAMAADLDYLRGSDVFAPGPATYADWSGFYVGAHGAYGLADVEFGMRALDLLSTIVPTTSMPYGVQLPSGSVLSLPPDNANFTSYGAFAGYNAQWEGAILGLEVNYHRTSLDASASASAPTFRMSGSGSVAFYNVDASVTSRVRLTDYATIRGRAGWAFGSFLPYATVGLAIGRADITNSALARFVAMDASGSPLSSFSTPATEAQPGHFGYGYALGIGFDWMVWSCLFLRVEYEFVEFTDFGDRTRFSFDQVVQRNVSLNAVRAGLGYKF